MPGKQISLQTQDGYTLVCTVFEADNPDAATIVIACATGVLASYYRRYAEFLRESGFNAITFDYRGIGLSAVSDLKALHGHWSDWGRYDLDAVLAYAVQPWKTSLVGHSFGGFAAGLAPHARELQRILMVGAQHAYWPDYQRAERLNFWYQWHLRMPLLTHKTGYFPGKRLGLTEDLPRGVAMDWARSPRDFTRGQPELRRSFAAVTAPIAAVAPTDDAFATPAATNRMLRYFSSAPSSSHFLAPSRYGEQKIGHFALFNDRFKPTFWHESIDYLNGENPWTS